MARSTARARLVEAAAGLLHRQGYASTGLNQILEHSRAPKGSLYFHFPGGKEELVAEALRGSAAGMSELLERVLEHAPSTELALDQIVAYFAAQLEGSSYTKGCPVATVALEQAATSDPLQRVCSAAYARWQQLIATRLIRDGFAAERADAFAGFALATIEGALLLCRAHRSTKPLRRAGAELRLHLTTKDMK
jgi:TetR/AcrR family transcriptional repressor of lmrAB and yxaGH operons